MSQIWERKPHFLLEYTDDRIEDSFLCHTCNQWYPWYKFCIGKTLAFGYTNTENTYLYMDNELDRGGVKWACDCCIKKILYYNKIITVTDKNNNLLDLSRFPY